MEAGTEFVLYGVAVNPQGLIGIRADSRVKVAGSAGSRSLSRRWYGSSTWPNTRHGQALALLAVEKMNAATAERFNLHASNMNRVEEAIR